jgi:hypothetical protein
VLVVDDRIDAVAGGQGEQEHPKIPGINVVNITFGGINGLFLNNATYDTIFAQSSKQCQFFR